MGAMCYLEVVTGLGYGDYSRGHIPAITVDSQT